MRTAPRLTNPDSHKKSLAQHLAHGLINDAIETGRKRR
jgi:hypothetical protein